MVARGPIVRLTQRARVAGALGCIALVYLAGCGVAATTADRGQVRGSLDDASTQGADASLGATGDDASEAGGDGNADEGTDTLIADAARLDALDEATVADDSGLTPSLDSGNLPPEGGANADASTDADAAPTCVPRPPSAAGIYVDGVNGSDATGDGTAGNPYQTIAAAIPVAEGAATQNVYLAPGTYAESVAFGDSLAGTTLIGGWTRNGASWASDCADGARTRTVIQGGTIAVHVVSVIHPSGFAHLTIQTVASATAVADTPGVSLIGLLVEGAGSAITLDDVAVVSGAAAAGGSASAGTASTGVISCTGTGDCSDGGAGIAPPAGTPAASAGSFSRTGFAPSDGQRGAAGFNGSNGTAGGGASSATNITGCNTGCGTDCSVTSMTTLTSQQGFCGCGGVAGAPGLQGRGGGASVALLLAGDGATGDDQRERAGGRQRRERIGGRAGRCRRIRHDGHRGDDRSVPRRAVPLQRQLRPLLESMWILPHGFDFRSRR